MADKLYGCRNPLLYINRMYGDLYSIERLLQNSDKVEVISKIAELKLEVGNLLNEFEAMGFTDEEKPTLNTTPLGADIIKETFFQKDDTTNYYNPKLAEILQEASIVDSRIGYSKSILPFCMLKVAEHGRSKKKYYMLEFSEGKYVKRVKLKHLDYDYVLKNIKEEYPDFMKRYASHLVRKILEG